MSRTPFLKHVGLDAQLAYAQAQLEDHTQELINAVGLIGQLNSAILRNDSQSTIAVLREYREAYGLSLLTMSKAMCLRHSTVADGAVRQAAADALTPYLTPRRHLITAALDNIMDKEKGYIASRRTFLGYAQDGRLLPEFIPIIVELMSPSQHTQDEIPYGIQAYSRWGAVDLLGYILRQANRLDDTSKTTLAERLRSIIPEALHSAWAYEFNDLNLSDLERLLSHDERFTEQYLTANAPAWHEYKVVQTYRQSVENAIGRRLDGKRVLKNAGANTFAAPKSTVSELLQRSETQFSVECVNPQNSGYLHRTIALISSIEANLITISSGTELKEILDQTVDVSMLLSLNELDKTLPAKRSDNLYEYLRTALLMDAEPSKVTNHAFRRALQKTLIDDFESDIIALIKYLDQGSGHVAEHLYYICTDYFLTELYDVYEEADQVVEAHAQLLEWHGSTRGDEDEILLARSYRLSLLLSKVRGSIEETRIYVDPLRFVQWLQAEMSSDLRSLADDLTQMDEGQERLGTSIDPIRALQEPRSKLLLLMERAYHEFCSNRINGIDSYIGRRIRHGTFHGRLVAELRPTVTSVMSELNSTQPSLSEQLGSWFASYESSIQEFASELLHVRSKEKARGLILPTLDDAMKLRARDLALADIIRALKERRPIAVSLSLMHEYCWVIFEADLQRCRDAVEELRRRFVVRPADFRGASLGDSDQRTTERIRHLNSVMLQQFENVRAWLIRPTSISPTASVELLFQAVLNEVSSRYPAFEPKLDFQGSAEVKLIGHRFHFFYDVLYILVDNAARHGLPHGQLTLRNSTEYHDEQSMTLHVSVSSDFDPATIGEATLRINDAMTSDVGDAMVKEGRSGLKKVRGLAEHVEEITGFDHRCEGASVTFNLHIKLPRS